jgi:hypothetical protein
MSLRRPTAAAVVVAFCAAGLTASLGWTVAKSARRIQKAVLYAGESAVAERSREFGPEYTQRIEEIRRVIPRDGVYALVDGDPAELGGQLWVRFDLAPRRAVFLGQRGHLPLPGEIRRRLPPGVRWVVVGYAESPPQITELPRFLAELERR